MKAVWDAKAQLKDLKGEPFFDSLLAEFLLSEGRYHLSEEETLKRYDAKNLEDLAKKQQDTLKELPKLQTLLVDIEQPLISVLCAMEDHGIILDIKRLQEIGEKLTKLITQKDAAIKKEVGYEINLASPIQVGTYLAEKAGVPLSKTKTGKYATNEQELIKHEAQFPIVRQILELRELAKLKSTYTESLIQKVDETGKVHTTYTQVGVSTGRLSSANPNLQNIPVTSEIGREIKSCFVASDGNTLLAFDYSQQELRILAHLTQEQKLIDAFTNNRDVHKTTASQLFNISYDEVTKEQRSIAKTINFGIIYGMSSYGMSAGLNIPVEEAAKFIDAFYANFPGIKKYYDQYLKQGMVDNYVETLLGRRRFVFPDANPAFAKATGGQRKFIDNATKRVLMNFPIQGTAADLMKMAMIKVHNDVVKKHKDVNLLLQIHDELVFEVPDKKEIIDDLVKQIKDIMCTVYELSVPVEVEAKIGKRWGEMTAVV